MRATWFNYDTDEYEEVDLSSSTMEDALPYIPSDPTARALFRLYVEYKEMDVMEVMMAVLEQCVPSISTGE